MATKEQLVKEAEAKWERDQLVQEAEAKWASENAPTPSGPGALETIETAGRSLAEGISGGLSEPAISGVNAVLGNLIESGFDADSLKDFFSKSIDAARIEKAFSKDVARRKALEEQLPGTAIASEVVGALAPFGLPAKIGRAAAGIAKGAEAIPVIGKLSAAASEAALAGAGTEAAKQAVQIPTGFEEKASLAKIPEAAAFGAKFGAGSSAAISALKAAPGVVTRGLSVFGGPSEEAITKYLADPEAVRRAKSPEEIKTLMDKTVLRLSDDLEKGIIGVSDAKSVLRQAEDDIRSTSRLAKQEIADALRESKRSFTEAKRELIEPIRAAKPPQGLTQDIIDASEELKKRVSEESEKSYKILENLEEAAKRKEVPRANLSDVPQLINTIQKDLKVNNRLISDEERAAYTALNKYKVELKGVFREQTPWPQVKRILQSIDRDIRKYGTPNSAEYSDLTRSKLLELRGSIDELIKSTSNEYRVQMEQVVKPLRDTLEDTAGFLGKDQKIQGKLEQIWKPANKANQDIVIALGKATDRDLAGPMNAYIQTKQLSSQPLALEALTKALPETKEVAKLEARMAMARRPGAEQFLAPAEVRARQVAQRTLTMAEQVAEKARMDIQSVGPFARESSNFNAIRGAVAGRNPDYEQKLAALTKLSGENFTQMINDLRQAEAFSRDFTRGSQNVNMFAMLSGVAAYGLTGSWEAAVVVGGLGGGIGKTMDRFGGQMTQKILDAYLNVKGTPTIQKIDDAYSDFPEPVKQWVRNEFVRSVAIAAPKFMDIPEDQKASVYSDLQNSDLDAVTKAKALNQISKSGQVESDTMKKYMLNEQPMRGAVKQPARKATLEADKPAALRR